MHAPHFTETARREWRRRDERRVQSARLMTLELSIESSRKLFNPSEGEWATLDLAALSPSDAAFYERRGWERWRGPLAIRRDGHIAPSPEDEQVMIRRLPRTPATIDTTALLTAEWRQGELW